MEIEYIRTFLICWIGLLSAYLGTFVSGWTSSLSVGLMMLIGIPAQITKATYQIGLFGWSISGIRNFLSSGHIPKTYLIGSVIATFFGGFIGGNLMTITPNSILQRVTGVVFLTFLFITWIRKRYKKTLQEKHITITRLRKNLTYSGQFVLSILSGYIPGAAWSLYFMLYTELLHINTLEYKALGRITGMALALGTLYPIVKTWLFHYEYATPFFIWMYIWWHFGTKHLIKMWNRIAEYIVYSSIFFLALYLLFF